MVKIKQITAREEKGSCLTQAIVVCEVHLTNGVSATAHVSFESLMQNKEGQKHISLSEIVDNIQTAISPFLEGKVADLVECDTVLEEIFISDPLSVVPPCIMQALSVAIAHAQVQAEQIQLFELFADIIENDTITIPYPFFQISNSDDFSSDFPLQGIFLIPLGAQNFRHSLGSFNIVKEALKKEKIFSTQSVEQVLKNVDVMLTQAKLRDVFVIGIQGNADKLYDHESGNYRWQEELKNGEELLLLYKAYIEEYGIFSIQNGFAKTDILGARTLLEMCGDRVQLIANQSLLAGDIPALEELKKDTNACIVKPDEYLTVSKALAHVMQIRSEGINTIISQRFTSNAAFFVDFAVGTSAGQIKTFNDNNSLIVPVCDRLLDIEDAMTFSLL